MKARMMLPGAVAAAALRGRAPQNEMMHGDSGGSGWKNLLAQGVGGFNNVGDANWRMADGALVADKGVGFLVTRESYGDFEMRAEFYAEADTNSRLFVRCSEKE